MAATVTQNRRRRGFDAWPGYVDVLSTLLMVVIFVLMVFVIAQFFLSTALTGRDEALERLTRQVDELSELLSLERSVNADLRLNLAELSAELQGSTAGRDELNQRLRQVTEERDAMSATLADVNAQLAALLGERDALSTSLEQASASLAETTDKLAIVIGERDALSAQARDAEERLKEASERLTVIIGERDALASDLATAQAQLAETGAALEEATQARLLVRAELEDAYKVIEADRAKIEALLGDIAALKSLRDEMAAEFLAAQERAREELATEKAISDEARLQIEILNRQLTSLRQQLARLAVALEASEAAAEEKNIQIANLGQRLNQALASKVEELARYRSEFFGRLREVLGDRPDIQIVGDRFVFQSEVLFASGSAELGTAGRAQLAQLAQTLIEIAEDIPPDVDWLLRVDGHTDRNPISTAEFPSNWELSTARAISVVKFLRSQGIPPERLAATGFAEFRPLDDRQDEIAYRRNRRIELKLDQR